MTTTPTTPTPTTDRPAGPARAARIEEIRAGAITRRHLGQGAICRRNLSPEQKAEARKRMKAVAKKLQEENPKKNTQARIAAILGVDRTTVGRWWKDGSKVHTHICSATTGGEEKPRPDARVKVPPQARPAPGDGGGKDRAGKMPPEAAIRLALRPEEKK